MSLEKLKVGVLVLLKSSFRDVCFKLCLTLAFLVVFFQLCCSGLMNPFTCKGEQIGISHSNVNAYSEGQGYEKKEK